MYLLNNHDLQGRPSPLKTPLDIKIGKMGFDIGGFKRGKSVNPSYFLDFWVKRGWIFRGLRGLSKIFEYGTIFVSEIWTFSKMVPYSLMNFITFLKWYQFCWRNIGLFLNSTILNPLFSFPMSKGVLFMGFKGG